MGRKKNPTTVKLEREIAKRDNEIMKLKEGIATPESSSSSPKEESPVSSELNQTTYLGIIESRVKGVLYPIRFNLETGEARIDLAAGKEFPGIPNLRHELSRLLVKGDLMVNKLKENK